MLLLVLVLRVLWLLLLVLPLGMLGVLWCLRWALLLRLQELQPREGGEEHLRKLRAPAGLLHQRLHLQLHLQELLLLLTRMYGVMCHR